MRFYTRRFLTLLMILTLLLSLVSCTGSGNKNNVPDDESQEDSPYPNLVGYTVRVLQEAGEKDPIFYSGNTVYADIMLSRIATIEKNINCDIHYTNVSGSDGDIRDYVQARSATGEYFADMAYTINDNMAARWANAGFLLPFSKVKDIIDYENEPEKYGNTTLLEITMCNSEVYKVCPLLLPDYINSMYVCSALVINENIIKSNNIKDPREYYEKSVWTWKNFENLLDTATINEGDNIIPALNAEKGDFIKCAALSNGVEYMRVNDSGFSSDIETPRMVEALDWVKRLLNEKSDSIVLDDIYWGGMTRFLAAKTVMGLTFTVNTVASSEIISEFGVLPFPSGPSNTYGEWGAYIPACNGMSMFSSTAAEPLELAYIISELFEPFEGLETPEAIINDAIENKYFTAQDAKIMMNLYKNADYFYGTFGGDDFWNSVTDNLDKRTSADLVTMYSNLVQKVIDEFISSNYEYLKNH